MEIFNSLSCCTLTRTAHDHGVLLSVHVSEMKAWWKTESYHMKQVSLIVNIFCNTCTDAFGSPGAAAGVSTCRRTWGRIFGLISVTWKLRRCHRLHTFHIQASNLFSHTDREATPDRTSLPPAPPDLDFPAHPHWHASCPSRLWGRNRSRLRLWRSHHAAARSHRATTSCGNSEAEDFPAAAAANQIADTNTSAEWQRISHTTENVSTFTLR